MTPPIGVKWKGNILYCSACGARVGRKFSDGELYISPGCTHLVAHFMPGYSPRLQALLFYAVAVSKVDGGFLLLLPRSIVEEEWRRE